MTTPDGLPADLPIPVDDGGAAHLVGSSAPAVGLPSTSGAVIRLDLLRGRTVVFAYPRTATPGRPSPTGWDAIPGARGCTPQACAIRDRYADFAALGARVFGLSTQPISEQVEAAQRLGLPYPLLSDSALDLVRAWALPTFSVDGLTVIRRSTLFLRDGVVDAVIYPVFPPDRAAQSALDRLGDDPPVPGQPLRGPAPGRGRTHPIPPPIVR